MTTGYTLEEVPTTILPNVAYSLGSLFSTEPTADIQGATGIDFSSTSTQGWVFSAILGVVAYPVDFGTSEGYTINNVPSSGSAGPDEEFYSFDGSVNGESGITFEPLSDISITFSQSFLNSHPTFTLADLPGLSIDVQDQFSSATFGGSLGIVYENSYNTIPIDYTGLLSANTPITITAPTAVTLNAGETDQISGVSIAGSSDASNVFTVTLSDASGLLSVGGQASTSLTISGSLDVVNSTLAALTDTDSAVDPDRIIVAASDTEGDPSTPSGIAVTVNGTPMTITAPPSQTIGVTKTHAIDGVSVSGSNDPNDVFTITLSDTNGILAAAGQAATTLTVSGSLDDVNGVLSELTDTDSVSGSDTIIITGSDTEKNFATPAEIPVTVNGAPTITAPTKLSPATGLTTVLAGISIAESGYTFGETFTVVLQDATGILGTNQNLDAAGNGTTKLTITGDIGSVNAELAALTDTATANDTIQMTVTDSFTNSASTNISITPAAIVPKPPTSAQIAVITQDVIQFYTDKVAGKSTTADLSKLTTDVTNVNLTQATLGQVLTAALQKDAGANAATLANDIAGIYYSKIAADIGTNGSGLPAALSGMVVETALVGVTYHALAGRESMAAALNQTVALFKL